LHNVKNAKTASVACQRCLIQHTSVNVVHGSSQGGSGCLERRRNGLATVNCSQGRRKIKGRVAGYDMGKATHSKTQHWLLLD